MNVPVSAPTPGSVSTPVSVNPQDLLAALSAASAVIDRVEWASRMGLGSFDGKRDLYDALGYKRTLTPRDYRERYERGGIASRIVEFLPKLAWAGNVTVQEVEEPEDVTNFEEDCDLLLTMDGLDVRRILQQADIQAGLGYYSVVLIGAPGDLNTELTHLSGPESLLYLTPLSQEYASIIDLDTDKNSRRFGLPLTYQLDLGKVPDGVQSNAPILSTDIGQKKVHWSRIVHVTKGSLFSRLYGRPVLQPVWNDLDNLYKIIGGGAETAWNIMSLPTLFSIDKDITFPSQEAMEVQLKEFRESIEKLRHKLEPYAYGRGVSADVIGNKGGLPQFGPDADAVMDQIAGTLGYPKRRLMGTEEAHQASTQDKGREDDIKEEHRRDCAEPILRQLLDRMIRYGGVRPLRKGNKKYTVEWPNEEEMTEAEKGELVKNLTLANLNQYQADGTIIVTNDEIRDDILGKKPLPKLDKKDITPSDPSIDPSLDPLSISSDLLSEVILQ